MAVIPLELSTFATDNQKQDNSIMILENVAGSFNSLQVSCYGNIPQGGDFSLPHNIPFHIKNISGEALVGVRIVGADGREMATTMDEGWNAECVYKVLNAPAGLQWGY